MSICIWSDPHFPGIPIEGPGMGEGQWGKNHPGSSVGSKVGGLNTHYGVAIGKMVLSFKTAMVTVPRKTVY